MHASVRRVFLNSKEEKKGVDRLFFCDFLKPAVADQFK
jgi:hypothetical protein